MTFFKVLLNGSPYFFLCVYNVVDTIDTSGDYFAVICDKISNLGRVFTRQKNKGTQ